MLTHAEIWAAIDRLAQERGLTASGLARRSGLDPTTFNKSKRMTREGKPRWPSTESIAKVLGATGASLTEFLSLIECDEGAARTPSLPLLKSVEVLGRPGLNGGLDQQLDEAHAINFPELGEKTFAIEMTDDRLAPAYRRGDVLIVSAGAQIRRGDRVLARTPDGQIVAGEVLRHGRDIALKAVCAEDHRETAFRPGSDGWVMRVLWASQ